MSARPSTDVAPHGPLLPAARYVPAPRLVQWFAASVFCLSVLTVFALFFLPWQQSVAGSGRVIALDPLQRPQTIEATIDGQVVEWYVREGARVQAGEPLLKIVDNDPNLLGRLQFSVRAAEDKVRAAQDKIVAYQDQIRLYQTARELQISVAEKQLEITVQKVRAAQETLDAADAALVFAQQVYDRKQVLFQQKLASQQDLENETQKLAKARTDQAKSRADLIGSERDQQVKRDYIDYARADAEAKIREANAKLGEAEGDLALSRESLLKAQRDLARYETQTIVAPRAGTVVRLIANQGGSGRQVKTGDALLQFVPDSDSLAAEVWVDGNDAPWVVPGRAVRLQFEGWPAVQFTAGIPEAALGTFGGRVLLVDATDNGNGRFRVLIVPSDQPGEAAWPVTDEAADVPRRALRQGVRVNSWILLGQVPLGYEFWRQLNGFPPVMQLSKEMQYSGGKETSVPEKKAK